jgi:histone-lysine N-methyltransferase SETMAR
LLHNDVHQAIWKRRPGKLSKKITLLHDNARPHMVNLLKATLATMGSEIMNHPPYSLDLAPSDFHLFGPVKMHLGGETFQTNDGLNQCPELAMQSG